MVIFGTRDIYALMLRPLFIKFHAALQKKLVYFIKCYVVGS